MGFCVIPIKDIMTYDQFIQEQQKLLPCLNVSRETFHRLERYMDLLKEQNQNLNLVGSSEMPNIWHRHVFDSMQLLPYIPTTATSVCDFGSGAGFPGIVLGILGVSQMTLVESIGKKVAFLENVSHETFLKNTILCDRVENMHKAFSVITARAVASLKDLLTLTNNIRTPETLCIFPKGKKYQEEIDDARSYFDFKIDVHQSVTHPEGKVLVISHVISYVN